MKLVGGDSGRCEHEKFVESVVLAPSERAVVDVLFDTAGEAALEHRTPERTYALAASPSPSERVEPAPTDAFATLRTNAGAGAPSASGSRRTASAEPDKTIAFVAEMDFEAPEGPSSSRARCTPRS